MTKQGNPNFEGKLIKTAVVGWWLYKEEIDKKEAAVLTLGIWADQPTNYALGTAARSPLAAPVAAAYVVSEIDEYGPEFLEWIEEEYQPAIQENIVQDLKQETSDSYLPWLNLFAINYSRKKHWLPLLGQKALGPL